VRTFETTADGEAAIHVEDTVDVQVVREHAAGAGGRRKRKRALVAGELVARAAVMPGVVARRARRPCFRRAASPRAVFGAVQHRRTKSFIVASFRCFVQRHGVRRELGTRVAAQPCCAPATPRPPGACRGGASRCRRGPGRPCRPPQTRPLLPRPTPTTAADQWAAASVRGHRRRVGSSQTVMCSRMH
jgi:hypothetical protein